MKSVELSDATAPLAEYAQQVASEPVIVTQEGQPVAALIGIENADLETVSLSTNPKFMALIERSRARLKAEGGISSDQLRQQLD